MQSGPSQFRDWMRRKGFNQAESADFFGVTESAISQYLSRERRPSLTVALRIEDATGIPPKAWMASDVDSTAKHSSARSKSRNVHAA